MSGKSTVLLDVLLFLAKEKKEFTRLEIAKQTKRSYEGVRHAITEGLLQGYIEEIKDANLVKFRITKAGLQYLDEIRKQIESAIST